MISIPSITQEEFETLKQAEEARVKKLKLPQDAVNTYYDTSSIIINNSASGSLTVPTYLSGTGDRVIYIETTAKTETKEFVRAEIIFEYLKANFTESEEQDLKEMYNSLSYIYKACIETGQVALKELTQRKLAQVCAEQEIRIKGFNKVIDKQFVDFFIKKADVKISFDKLANFPRVIPDEIRQKIQAVKALGMFEELYVLYMNPADESIKTNAEQIKDIEDKKKDPILFGVTRFSKDRLIYIVDWIDEICDLTFDVFVRKMHCFSKDFKVEELEPLTAEEVEKLKEEVIELDDRITATWNSPVKSLRPEKKRETYRERLKRLLNIR